MCIFFKIAGLHHSDAHHLLVEKAKVPALLALVPPAGSARYGAFRQARSAFSPCFSREDLHAERAMQSGHFCPEQ